MILGRGDRDIHVLAESTATNEGKTPYELFYRMKPDVGHARTFGCVVEVVLPSQTLGKLDDRAAMGYLLGYKYDGGYRVWVPKKGVRETRDVVSYDGEAPMTPIDGASANFGAASTRHLPRSYNTEQEHETEGVPDSPDTRVANG